MHYDVQTGYSCDPPKLFRIKPTEGDGSCTNITEAKEWWLSEFEAWCDDQLTDLKEIRATDIPYL